jgi:hypothetical protein
MKPKLLTITSALALFAVLAASGTPAEAATTTGCSPSLIQFDDNSLALWCLNDANSPYVMYRSGASATCPTQAAGTLTLWYSMMTATQHAYTDKKRTTRTMSFDYIPAVPNVCWGSITSLRMN